MNFDIWGYINNEMSGHDRRVAAKQQRQIDAFGAGPAVLEYDGGDRGTVYTFSCDGYDGDYSMRPNNIWGTPDHIRTFAHEVATFMGHDNVIERHGPGDPTAPEVSLVYDDKVY